MSTVGQPKTPEEIQKDWNTNPRWKGITRTYTPADVVALQGTVVEENTLARRGAGVLWDQLHDMEFVKRIAHVVTVLHQGKLLAEGKMEKVQEDPRVIEVYLGH